MKIEMRMKRQALVFGLLIGLLVVVSSCKNDSDDPEVVIELTQATLNQSVQVEDLNVSGTPYGQDVSIPHNGSTISPDSTLRDIYANVAASAAITPGTIFTKRTHIMNTDGSKGELQVTFAMIKRESGYNPDGGDFEYVMMPFSTSNNYTDNPNGMLPDVSQTEMRGKLQMCASCHSKAAGYVFVRN